MDGKVKLTTDLLPDTLLRNHHLPLDKFCKLARWVWDFGDYTMAICSRPDTPAHLLAQCSRSTFSTSLLQIAEHPKANRMTLLRLARVGDSNVVERAIAHPSFPKEMIVRLANCSHDPAREVIAQNTNDPEALAKLSTDARRVVRLLVTSNPSTPPDVLARMGLTDTDQSIVAEVAANAMDPAVLDSIAERIPEFGSESLTRAILANPYSTDHAKTIAVLSSQE